MHNPTPSRLLHMKSASHISTSALNAAIRKAWIQSGRHPTWPSKPRKPSGAWGNSQQGLHATTFERIRPFFHLIGVESDTEVARRSCSYRPTISWIRSTLNIPARPRIVITVEQKAECLRRLRAGEPLNQVARAIDLGVVSVRNLAETIGWDESWSRQHRLPKPAMKIGRLSRARIEAELRKGANRSRLARLAGVSPQRIGQIATYAGIPGRRELLRPKREAARLAKEKDRDKARKRRLRERLARPARYRAKLRKYLAKARTLHRRGKGISEIAKVYRMPTNSMAWWLFRGRRDLGWFPVRQ